MIQNVVFFHLNISFKHVETNHAANEVSSN